MYNFKEVEEKWQDKWKISKTFKAKPKGKKYYNLEMFAYPSSYGLHIGHARTYTISDANARFRRMQGLSVLYPTGYDSFGLPAENAAIKEGVHPKEYTETSIKNFMRQQELLGLSYDWDRLVVTSNPDYYRWNQWLFLKMFKKGLAYKKKAPVNWCNECNTVLANEQVVGGCCWRHENEKVIIKELDQWFFKITDYADELLRDINELEWAERIKEMQRNWIGKSEGTLVNFKLENGETIPVFTTRPDTLFGVTFLVFAPEHPKVIELIKNSKDEDKIKDFINRVAVGDRSDRENENKEGMFTGKYAINPVNKEKVPIYIASFVLYGYGTGAVMGVPAHDQRDYDFARKYNLKIKLVIKPSGQDLKSENLREAYVGEGELINSGEFNGLDSREAIDKIARYLEQNKLGKKTVQFKLRDWLISRQRYWGCPIPITYCEKCGMVLVNEEDLPVKLPMNVEFKAGGNPLAGNDSFVKVKCSKCGGKARRETDTMDTFVDSSWYFLRYCSPKSDKIFDDEVTFWMPIDQYIGGREHATGHLIYFRFFTKVLRDLGLLKIDEPARRLFNQGDVNKDGVRMSKSRGNTIDPIDVINKYGADSLRLFLLFVAGPDKTLEWEDKGIEGSFKFLNKVWSLVNKKIGKDDDLVLSKRNRLIRDVTKFLEEFKFNIAVINLMDFVDFLSKQERVSKESLDVISRLLNPFCPHLSEELWEKIKVKGFVSLAEWPKFQDRYISDEVEYELDLVEEVNRDIKHVFELIKKEGDIKIFVAEKWKYMVFKKLKNALKKTRDINEILKEIGDNRHMNEISKITKAVLRDASKMSRIVLDQEKEEEILRKAGFDVIRAEESMEEKAKKAMPGKPAILVT